ncbi:unnamed protein product [Natator depressus]
MLSGSGEEGRGKTAERTVSEVHDSPPRNEGFKKVNWNRLGSRHRGSCAWLADGAHGTQHGKQHGSRKAANRIRNQHGSKATEKASYYNAWCKWNCPSHQAVRCVLEYILNMMCRLWKNNNFLLEGHL